jgi:hypothetical protein
MDRTSVLDQALYCSTDYGFVLIIFRLPTVAAVSIDYARWLALWRRCYLFRSNLRPYLLR